MSFQPGPWCSNEKCPCNVPNGPCSTFEGYEDNPEAFDVNDKETWPHRYCICCGFERSDHKGGKP